MDSICVILSKYFKFMDLVCTTKILKYESLENFQLYESLENFQLYSSLSASNATKQPDF